MANYYLKARFADAGRAKKALPAVKAFLLEGYQAEVWWQEHRDTPHVEFWTAFIKHFPLVSEYLKTVKADESDRAVDRGAFKPTRVADKIAHPLDKVTVPKPQGHLWADSNNGLSGCLDFGSADGENGNDIDNLDRHGDQVWYWAYVWHLCSWDPFVRYLETHFGAVKTDWESDEHLDPFDAVHVE